MTAVVTLLGLAAGAFVFAKVADLFECPAAGDLFSWACGGLTAFALIALLLTSAGHRLALYVAPVLLAVATVAGFVLLAVLWLVKDAPTEDQP